MKYSRLHLYISTALLFMLCSCGPTPKLPVHVDGEDTASIPPKKKTAPISKMPYSISVSKSETQPTNAIPVQSAAHAFDGKYLMMVGGRIQGFHGTANATGVFDSKYSNDKISILNPQTGDFKSMDLPKDYKTFLMSTNMEYYYDGTYMLCVGGYGAYCTTCTPEQFRTFPRLTAIDFSKAVSAIEANDATALASSMVSIEDERFRVTGGGLEKMGDDYYLVFGQDYDTIYIGGITGKYTEQVRKFKLDIGETITVSDYKVYKDASASGVESQYHRRDLNVCSAIRPDGSDGISVFGGVFTKNDGGWVYPIMIDGERETTVEVVKTMEQKLSQYECAVVSLYDPTSQNMFHTLLGGISYYFYDGGVLKPSTIDNWLPFTSSITTIVHGPDQLEEFPQPETESLPALLGSDAAFIPNPDLAFASGSDIILDLSKIGTGKTKVGWMYGGIEASAAQSSEFNPTSASSTLYDVWLTR